MTQYRLGNDIEIGYDSNAYEKSYGRIWVPTDRDRQQFYSSDNALEWRRTPSNHYGEFFMRLFAHGIDDPVKIGCSEITEEPQYLQPEVKDAQIRNEWKHTMLKYVGYPFYADVRHPNVNERAIYYVSAWIGQPTNENIEAFYVVDYNGNYITPGQLTITANTPASSLPAHIIAVYNRPDPDNPSAPFPTIPLTTLKNGVPVEDQRIGECTDFDILTRPGRIDTDTRVQYAGVLDIVRQADVDAGNNQSSELGNPKQRSFTADAQVNAFKGVLKTRTGFSVVPSNWDNKFRGIVVSSEVFPSTKSTFNATGTLDAGIVDPSKHVLVIVIPERQAPFTDTPQGVITEQSVNGIFEIPFGSGRLYNLVGFSESDNSSATLTFEVVAT